MPTDPNAAPDPTPAPSDAPGTAPAGADVAPVNEAAPGGTLPADPAPQVAPAVAAADPAPVVIAPPAAGPAAPNEPPAALLKAAVAALAASVASITKQTVAETTKFAERFGPDAVRWGIERYQAQATGNADALFRLDSDFAELKLAAVIEAADLGVRLQQASEKQLMTALETAAHFAAAAVKL